MFGEKKKRIPGEFDAAFAGMAQGYSPLSQATASQGAIGNMAPVNNAVAAAPTTLAPKKGLFGKGGVGRAIAGTIGDFLMQRSGMAPVYAPAMMQERQAAAQAAAEQRAYSMELAKHDAKKQIDARYDRPAIQQTAEYIERTEGPEAAAAYRRNYGQRPEEPRMVSIPGRGSFFGTMAEVQAWLRGGPQAVPVDPSLWDQGEPVGGPTQPASGSFRR